jgi:hypothetical protein
MGRLFVMSLVTIAKTVDALLNDICCRFNDYFRHLLMHICRSHSYVDVIVEIYAITINRLQGVKYTISGEPGPPIM